MDVNRTLYIIKCLADGIDPHTGEVLAVDSPCQHPETVRALFNVIQALDKDVKRQKREQSLPDNAGKSWDLAEDHNLCSRFAEGVAITDLAKIHSRTRGAIQSRLEKLGKLIPGSSVD